MRLASTLSAFQLTTPLTLTRHHRSLVSLRRALPYHIPGNRRLTLFSHTRMVAALPSPTTHPPSLAGKNPVFAQCMLRINDPTASNKFYSDLGMRYLTRFDFPSYKFSLFFFAYSDAATPQLTDPQPERADFLWSRPEPTVELTWNWPSDTYEESIKLAKAGDKTEEYVNGNQDPTGFGYIEVAVNDVGAAVAGLKEKGVKIIEQTARNGRTSATVADPDGYHIRITGPKGTDTAKPMAELDPVYDAIMLRIKDPRAAINFFEHLGFRYVTRIDNDGGKSTEYYLAYTNKTADDIASVQKMRECKLKLLHTWGTEEESEQMYTNGNVKPNRGFGHVGIIVDDIYKTMEEMGQEGYQTIRKPGPFADVGEIGFVGEPSTNYWIEVIKRAGTAADLPYEQPVFG